MATLHGEEAAKLITSNHDLLSSESDRGAVLICAALLDSSLEKLIKAKLVKCSDSESDPIFSGSNGPLSTFSAKIEMAYRLGLVHSDIRQLLHAFRRLRNDFAHSSSPRDFSDPGIKNRMLTIFGKHKQFHTALVELVKTSIRKSLADPHQFEDFYANHWPIRETFNFFFAGTTMALERVSVDVEHLEAFDVGTEKDDAG